MPLDENTKKTLKQILEKVLVQFADSASQLLNEELSASISSVAESKFQGNQINITEASFLLTASLQDQSLGNIYIVFNKATAIQLAAKMMGFEPGADIDESGKDAVVSLFTQSFIFPDEAFQISSIMLSELDPANPESLNIATKNTETSSVNVSINLGSFNSNIIIEVPNSLSGSSGEASSEEAELFNRGEGSSSISDTDFAEIKKAEALEGVDRDKNLNLLMDIRMGLIVELGRAEMHLKDILKLTKGSIIELDRLSGEPVDLFVNNKLVARGEVVVIDDNFGLRITQLAGTKNKRAEDLGLLAAGD